MSNNIREKINLPTKGNETSTSPSDVFMESEVAAFVDELKKEYPEAAFSVEGKIDGLGLSLVYNDGVLVKASICSDGHVGEDVTENIKALKSVPIYINTNIHHIELRGECYVNKTDLERVNSEQMAAGKELFANSQDCVVNTLHQSGPSIAMKRNLQVLISNVQMCDAPSGSDMSMSDSHWIQMQYLKKRGFRTPNAFLCKKSKEVLAAIKYLDRGREELDYRINGAVVKLDNLDITQKLNENAKMSKWAVAFKHSKE